MMDLGKVEIQPLSGVTDVCALIVAATRLHDSLAQSPAAVVAALPESVRRAHAELQNALARIAYPAQAVRLAPESAAPAG